ncbi:N-acetylmuramoyl-L-alanine amidase family protein [Flavobacterium silvaticum]|uniref:N-acetylmuramoyl-L-alanine amidase n=1 Tax=Flavobacterium silvaticum TaxID=1852020 RepID=A0A972FLE3_9FLAO|nr:N-acetylmuramoyl-L-alanine amidase [Flavobacterium silvaticum]NMH28141.1 N-acetylmuramoyl-L-alanine amidase [Flavobacterium silvaticum]
MKTNLKLLLACAILPALAFIQKPVKEREHLKVVIDAGHGGIDFGAQHDGLLEKDIVAGISSKILELSKGREIDIYLTRENDDYVKLDDRTQKINGIKPDVVVSLHINASENSQKSGTEFYIAKESNYKKQSQELAERLGYRFGTILNRAVPKIDEAPFHVLKKSEAPSMIIELGYVTNEADRKFLTDENSQQQIAKTLVDFMDDLPQK